jgi:hypothetical protein
MVVGGGWFLQMLKSMCLGIDKVCPVKNAVVGRGDVDGLSRWAVPLIASWNSQNFVEWIRETH